MPVHASARCHEGEVKEGEIVHQLIDRTTVRLSKRSVLPDEAASVKVVQALGHLAAFGDPRRCGKGVPRHSYLLRSKSRYQPDVRIGALEKRCVQLIELPFKLVAFREEHLVYVLRDTLPPLKEMPVVVLQGIDSK